MKTNFKTTTVLTAFLLGITLFANAQEISSKTKKGWNGVAEKTKMTKADSGKIVAEESLKKGWNGKTPACVNPENGAILYFEYKEDYVCPAEVCKALGVESCIIAKGIYQVERKDPNSPGTVTLSLVKPLMVTNNTVAKLETYGPKGPDCKSAESASCFYSTEPANEKDTKQMILITPERCQDGRCSAIKIAWNGKGVDPRNPGF